MVGGRTQRDPGDMMADNVNDLVLDLLEWLGSGPRPYVEVLDAWRTSCPRLPVWEEANERGFVERVHGAGGGRGAGSASRSPTSAPRICAGRGLATADPGRSGEGRRGATMAAELEQMEP